jgi:hypothetical protein
MNVTPCTRDLTVDLPSTCRRWQADEALAVPACNLVAPQGAFWLWKPAGGCLERLVVPYRAEADAVVEMLRALNPPWLPKKPARQEGVARHRLAPHTACALGPTALIWASLNGVNTYRLDTGTGTNTALCRNGTPPVWTFSSTPGLSPDGDRLYTARWNIENDARPDDATGYSEVIGVDLRDGTETVYARTPIAHSIHQVAAVPDGRRILLNEFLTGLNGPLPDLAGADHRTRLETLRPIGVKPSRLALVDMQTGDCTVWTCPWPAPTHVVFDPDDPAVFYLVCHNLAVIAGKLYLFGAGSLVRLRIKDREFQMEAEYSHASFHRLASHELFTCRGRKAIAVTVYPNRCEIIDAERFTRLALIDLYPIARLEADGLAVPDLNAEYAFSVCAMAAEDLLVLSGSRRLYVVDTRSEPPHIESLVYNDDPTWAARAHMARLA